MLPAVKNHRFPARQEPPFSRPPRTTVLPTAKNHRSPTLTEPPCSRAPGTTVLPPTQNRPPKSTVLPTSKNHRAPIAKHDRCTTPSYAHASTARPGGKKQWFRRVMSALIFRPVKITSSLKRRRFTASGITHFAPCFCLPAARFLQTEQWCESLCMSRVPTFVLLTAISHSRAVSRRRDQANACSPH